MSRRDLIDPELRVPLDYLLQAIPGGFNAVPDVVQRRAVVDSVRAGIEVPENPRVVIDDRVVPGPVGEPDIRLRVYRPVDAEGPLPCVYSIHSGGLIMGSVDQEDAVAAMICDLVGVVVVSVGYRLAPENPYPAAVEDCYAGLVWTAEHAADLDIDPDRLGLHGGSSGGGLAVAVALMARDRGGPALKFMMPIYPMLDDRNETPSSHEIVDVGMWDRAANIEAWDWYLGGKPADQYAAPSRAEDVAGLPPAFIDVGTIDLFRDEDIVFALRLMRAGVPTELHVYPGAYHGSENFAPDAALAKRIWAARIDALRRFVA